MRAVGSEDLVEELVLGGVAHEDLVTLGGDTEVLNVERLSHNLLVDIAFVPIEGEVD